MSELSPPIQTDFDFDRIIDQIEGQLPGPHLIFFAGIHGNEPSGVWALRNVLQKIRKEKIPLKGKVTALAGNLRALQKGKRFEENDLNRLWTKKNIEALSKDNFQPENEDEIELEELFALIQEIIRNQSGPLYFFDLHTTSSQSIPFIPVNDSLINRAFAQQYPLPLILGIEEYIEGPMLSYINELGFVSFGFEGGQHTDPNSVKNHERFIQLSLAFAGSCDSKTMNVEESLNVWKKEYGSFQEFYEIFFRFEVEPESEFKMNPGFKSFQEVTKGEKLAISGGKAVHSPKNTQIFMPLYQAQGRDGFFLIRKTPQLFLSLSAFLRKRKLDRLITWLPGVQWASPEKDAMRVDLRIAKFLAKPILHLFGYRAMQKSDHYMIIWNREWRSRFKDYQEESWYQSDLPS
ncbi:succinylglutamate desuccinylase/aspartoacylase domain-containing protein [Algoriphagus formosus]|uniref:succinylglutamate desuccinylase/aspartoacylase domain-containing protein n=1 Tax=Algoriphagus formosus TaxID=2007308 RepID=UPI0012FDC634|nr:succinylglutamate desuccinylase/aspartoacylase family protein [Algoriphagus formosus]